jgi:hypothetical protein
MTNMIYWSLVCSILIPKSLDVIWKALISWIFISKQFVLGCFSGCACRCLYVHVHACMCFIPFKKQCIIYNISQPRYSNYIVTNWENAVLSRGDLREILGTIFYLWSLLFPSTLFVESQKPAIVWLLRKSQSIWDTPALNCSELLQSSGQQVSLGFVSLSPQKNQLMKEYMKYVPMSSIPSKRHWHRTFGETEHFDASEWLSWQGL